MKEPDAFAAIMSVIRSCYNDPMSGMKIEKQYDEKGKLMTVEYVIGPIGVKVNARFAIKEPVDG